MDIIFIRWEFFDVLIVKERGFLKCLESMTKKI